ncbi:type II toxin-antitoxin system HicA family toxin [Staphylococcus simulans]
MSSSREVIKKIERSVPHPRKDLPRGTERSILKQAGL